MESKHIAWRWIVYDYIVFDDDDDDDEEETNKDDICVRNQLNYSISIINITMFMNVFNGQIYCLHIKYYFKCSNGLQKCFNVVFVCLFWNFRCKLRNELMSSHKISEFEPNLSYHIKTILFFFIIWTHKPVHIWKQEMTTLPLGNLLASNISSIYNGDMLAD